MEISVRGIFMIEETKPTDKKHNKMSLKGLINHFEIKFDSEQ